MQKTNALRHVLWKESHLTLFPSCRILCKQNLNPSNPFHIYICISITIWWMWYTEAVKRYMEAALPTCRMWREHIPHKRAVLSDWSLQPAESAPTHTHTPLKRSGLNDSQIQSPNPGLLYTSYVTDNLSQSNKSTGHHKQMLRFPRAQRNQIHWRHHKRYLCSTIFL